MKFKKDKSGKLEKIVNWTIKKYRPELENLVFLCAWRDKEKYEDGQLVLAEVQKLSPKFRDTVGYDVLLIVDYAAYKQLSKEEKKKLIFHELEHIKLEYDIEKSIDKENASSQELFEDLLKEPEIIGEPKIDKDGRVKFSVRPHNLQIKRFTEEIRLFGLSPDEEAIRQYLNFMYKKVGLAKDDADYEEE